MRKINRSSIIFVLFVLIVAVIVGISQFLQARPPLIVTIVVDPLAEDWLQDAADAFNQQERVINGITRLQVNLTTTSEMRVWQGNTPWNFDDHPQALVPTSSASVSFAPANVPWTLLEASLARSPLMWGGFQSRVDVLTDDGTRPFTWGAVADAAQAERWDAIGGDDAWNFVKLAYNRPSATMSGVGTLLSAAGNFANLGQLDPATLSDPSFVAWFERIRDSVPSFQTLGSNPASAMAGRGPSTVEIAILPEVQWLTTLEGLLQQEPMVFAYPTYQLVLDFPLAIWDDANLSEEERAAVRSFADFMLSDEGQGIALSNGLRPVNGAPSTGDALFGAALPYGVLLEPDLGVQLAIPDRVTVERLIRRFE